MLISKRVCFFLCKLLIYVSFHTLIDLLPLCALFKILVVYFQVAERVFLTVIFMFIRNLFFLLYIKMIFLLVQLSVGLRKMKLALSVFT